MARINRVCRFQLSLYFTKLIFEIDFHSEMFTTDPSRLIERDEWMLQIRNQVISRHSSQKFTWEVPWFIGNVHDYIYTLKARSATSSLSYRCRIGFFDNSICDLFVQEFQLCSWEKWKRSIFGSGAKKYRVFPWNIASFRVYNRKILLSEAEINQTNKNPRTEKSINEVCLVNHVTAKRFPRKQEKTWYTNFKIIQMFWF